MYKKYLKTFLVTGIFLVSASSLHAQINVDELRNEIEQKGSQIQKLENEIREFQVELDKTTVEAQTLQKTISNLETTTKKISTDINVTKTKIDTTNLTLEELGFEINEHERLVIQNKKALAQAIRDINERENESLIEVMLRTENMSDAWSEVENLVSFQRSLQDGTENLLENIEILANKRGATETQKQRLERLERELKGQKQSVETTKQEKDTILKETKNKEAEYQRLIAIKQEQKREFEQALFEYESQLKEVIDRTKLPTQAPGTLVWPVENVRITQLFGRTVDSERLYTSGTHNGVDFGVPSGTAVKSVTDGIVIGSGNTDLKRGCYSYGQWLLVEHTNGLTSLYAHLSGVAVNVGSAVRAGETIAYSGNTGYSTGPHLHLTIFASGGVEIGTYRSGTPCNGARIPLPTKKNAYLDPMPFLPSL